MSGFIPFGTGGASQPGNPAEEFSLFTGLGPDGVTITNSNGANTLSNWSSFGTIPDALSAIDLYVGSASATSARFQVSLRVNGVVAMTGTLHIQLATSVWQAMRIPIKVPAGATVEIATRNSANGSSIQFNATGVKELPTLSPGFTSIIDITGIVTGGVRPSLIDVGNSGAWVAIGTPAQSIGAFTVNLADTGAAPATGYRGWLLIGAGSPGSEVEIHRQPFNAQTSAPYYHTQQGRLVRKAASSGVPLSAKVLVTTPNSDLMRVGLAGYVP